MANCYDEAKRVYLELRSQITEPAEETARIRSACRGNERLAAEVQALLPQEDLIGVVPLPGWRLLQAIAIRCPCQAT